MYRAHALYYLTFVATLDRQDRDYLSFYDGSVGPEGLVAIFGSSPKVSEWVMELGI